MKKSEINELAKVKTHEDILKLYPEAKVVQNKLCIVFYQIKPRTWIRCSYMWKDGSCSRDHNSGKIDDIDRDHLSLDIIYTGNETKREYKTIWSCEPKWSDGIYKPKNYSYDN